MVFGVTGGNKPVSDCYLLLVSTKTFCFAIECHLDMPYFADKGNDIKQINCSYDIWNATAILLIVEALHPSFTSDFISCWINNEFFGLQLKPLYIHVSHSTLHVFNLTTFFLTLALPGQEINLSQMFLYSFPQASTCPCCSLVMVMTSN